MDPQIASKLNRIITGRGIGTVRHYQDFFLKLIHDGRSSRREYDGPPTLRLQMYADWYLDGEERWNQLVRSIRNMYAPASSEAVKALVLLPLKDHSLTDVSVSETGEMCLRFSEDTRIFVPGRARHTDIAWRLDANNDPNYNNFYVECADSVIRQNISLND